MPSEDGGAGSLLPRLAAIEQRLLDDPHRGLDREEARFLIGALRGEAAAAAQFRAERDAACRALLQDWPELPELGPAEVEDLLDQLGLVTEAEGEDGRTLQLTSRALDVLGLPAEDAPAPGPRAPDLMGICRALGLGTVLHTPDALRALAQALMAAAAEPAFWPAPDAAGDEGSSSPSS